MEERFPLRGPHLWTREAARPLREEVARRLERLAPGDVLVVDAAAVEVFDFSFAAELFGRTVLVLPGAYPGRFFAVEHLTPYARENLETMLERMDLAMVELVEGHPHLLGKVHPADEETLNAMVSMREPITAAQLRERLGVTINAANERLSKLVSMGLVRRERSKSPAGREQFLYRTLS